MAGGEHAELILIIAVYRGPQEALSDLRELTRTGPLADVRPIPVARCQTTDKLDAKVGYRLAGEEV